MSIDSYMDFWLGRSNAGRAAEDRRSLRQSPIGSRMQRTRIEASHQPVPRFYALCGSFEPDLVASIVLLSGEPNAAGYWVDEAKDAGTA